MYDIRILSDMDEAFTFYHAYSAATPDEVRANHGRVIDGYPPALFLMPVERATVDYWFAGEGRITLGAYQGNRLVGIASGAVSSERRTGFLSYLCVAPDCRRRGVATELCDGLETALAAQPEVEKLEVVFHNPVGLPWYIPNQSGDWHPCLPGVDKASGLYLFLKKRGWRDYAHQNCYYRRMADYADKPGIAATRQRLRTEGIELTLYDPATHHGLPELFDNIRNPGWKAHVLAHSDLPIVVAVDWNADGLVVGYTGPLSVVGTPGRGNFCGIGVRTEYRGRGIGKPVFCEMCARHRDGGADFMSLYTGEDNPARRIYESAGFRVVRSFADMRKELKDGYGDSHGGDLYIFGVGRAAMKF